MMTNHQYDLCWESDVALISELNNNLEWGMLFRFAKQNTAKSRFLEIAEYNGITMITELMMMLMITMIKIRSLNKKSWYTMAYCVYTCMLAYDCIPFWFSPKLCERKFKLKIGIAKYL